MGGNTPAVAVIEEGRKYSNKAAAQILKLSTITVQCCNKWANITPC